MPFDTTTLDGPFTALAAFEWGGDAAPLGVIDAAMVAAHGDAVLTANLEKRLGSIISGASSRAAKDYACPKLSMIGTTASVPALAPPLADSDESHMARFALERIPAPATRRSQQQRLPRSAESPQRRRPPSLPRQRSSRTRRRCGDRRPARLCRRVPRRRQPWICAGDL